MAGLVSVVGSTLMPEALVKVSGRHAAAFVAMTALVTLIAADSPVADESPLDSTYDPWGSSSLSSPFGLFSSRHAAPGSLTRPGRAPPSSKDTPVHSGLFTENSKSSRQSDVPAEEPHPASTPALNPSKHALGFSPQSEVPTNLYTDWKAASTNSAKQTFTLSPTLSNTQSNVSMATSNPSTSTLYSTPEKRPPESTLSHFSKQQLIGMTSQSGQTPETPNLAFTHLPANESHSQSLDVNQLSPSRSPVQEDKPALGMTMSPNSDLLAPGYNMPSFATTPTSPLSEPTEVTPDEFYPSNTMDVDWGSGDYLETMSFLDSDGDDYSMVTRVPVDPYDLEDYTESYDTSFPSRVGVSPSSSLPLHTLPSPSLMTAYNTAVPPKSIDPSPFSSTIHYTLAPTPTADSGVGDTADVDWPDAVTIQPTDVLLPDMNSLEYYTIQLTKENSSDVGAEHRGNITMVTLSTTEFTTTSSFNNDTTLTDIESSSDLSGFEPPDETTTMETPQLVNVSEASLDPSLVSSHFFDPSASTWGGKVSTTDWSASSHTAGLDSIEPSETVLLRATPSMPDYVMSSSSLTDVHWFVTDVFEHSTIIHSTPVLTPTPDPSSVFTESFTNTTAGTTEIALQDSPYTTEQPLNISSVTTELASNATSGPPVVWGDESSTDDEFDTSATTNVIPTSSDALPSSTTGSATQQQDTTTSATTEASTNASIIPSTSERATPTAPPSKQYLCNVNSSDYLIKVGFPPGVTTGFAKSQIRDILKAEFNKSVELQVVDPPPKFVFRAVSGPVVYTAISVVNSLRSARRRFLYVSPSWRTPDSKYQVHTVLQFVPNHVDVRFCNFSESIGKGLTKAFAEVRRRSKESTNFTVHIVNITMALPKSPEQRLLRQPVDITFTVRGSWGYLNGSEVSNALMKLSKVEFSYYMGFPVLQIAEPFHYPELNTSQVLRSSWVRTVLLGVLDQQVQERTFQANMERRVAMLLGEAMGPVRRVKRATSIGNSSVQVVSASRVTGDDHPLEIVYFVEDPSGQRVPAAQTADLLNNLDVQRAAIVLGYRVQGVLAQPVEKGMSSPTNKENTNTWIVIGVVIPLLIVIVIISILYWKMCRTDKLEFQPDAMTSMQQQRQKSTLSLGEPRTPQKTLLLAEMEEEEYEEEEYECYEDEEEDEEEEEEGEDDEEEEKDFKMGKSPLAQSENGTSSDEEEEDGGALEKVKVKNKGTEPDEQSRRRERSRLPKKTGWMKKEDKMKVLPVGRRVEEELQPPSVKGFDFAKLHLGQQSKDDIMVIQETAPPGPGSLPMSGKEGLSPSENGELPAPAGKTSSTKASRGDRRRERISPSDVDSVVSDRSSEQETAEENLRAHGTPSDGKQGHKVPINVLNGRNRIGPPPANGTHEQLSSAAIFEHVDRMSRPPDASRRLPNKVQLIAMQPIPVPPLHSPPVNGKLSDTNQINKEIQVALRHKSEIEHHRNKIRLRAKRKGHYDFPTMDEMTGGPADLKEQDRLYQKAQMQIDKILDPDAQMPPIFMESKKSGRGRRSPKQRMKEQLNGGVMDADKDHLISEDSDAAYRKCPGVNNVAYVSDPDQGPGSPHRSPSPSDDVFLGPASSPPGHAPPPPPYMPPQPSIEEARQQMHSLLDDAFALVSPTSQGSTSGITLPGVTSSLPGSSPPGKGSRPWGPSYPPLGPYPGRFSELAMSPPSVQGLTPRQGLGSSYLPPGETAGLDEHYQPDSLYSSRGLYADELPSSARPRPVGGTAGAQFHHLTQVGLSSRVNGYPGTRSAPGQNGGSGWNHYHDDNFPRAEVEKDAFLDCPDYESFHMFQMPRSSNRESSAPPPSHLDGPAGGYASSAPPHLDTSPPAHSSASLIKAIREELLRLSQKQAALPSYHS